jgi:hypothetical protein
MLTCSPESFTCSQCSYTTKRKYNFIRHIRTVHNIQETVDLQNVDDLYKNVDDNSKNIDVDLQNVDVLYKNVDALLNKCSKCNKCLSTKYYLKKHMESCSNKENPLKCTECHKIFSSRSGLSHHKKVCKGFPLVIPDKSKELQNIPIQANNMIQQNAQTINNVTNNVNITVLTCPQSVEENFKFNCDNITPEVLMNILKYSNNSFIRFNKFISKLLENPVNRVIRKTNPKDNHSLIHVGNNKWDYAHDKDMYPIITHHMTTAALDKTIEMEQNKKDNFIKCFQKQVKIFNEMDYDSQDYHDVVQRIKYLVINITRSVLEEAQRIQI